MTVPITLDVSWKYCSCQVSLIHETSVQSNMKVSRLHPQRELYVMLRRQAARSFTVTRYFSPVQHESVTFASAKRAMYCSSLENPCFPVSGVALGFAWFHASRTRESRWLSRVCAQKRQGLCFRILQGFACWKIKVLVHFFFLCVSAPSCGGLRCKADGVRCHDCRGSKLQYDIQGHSTFPVNSWSGRNHGLERGPLPPPVTAQRKN